MVWLTCEMAVIFDRVPLAIPAIADALEERASAMTAPLEQLAR